MDKRFAILLVLFGIHVQIISSDGQKGVGCKYGVNVVCRYEAKTQFELGEGRGSLFLYTCQGEKIDCKDDNNDTQIWGQHLHKHTHFDVEAFSLNDANLTHFPQGIDKYFTNLHAISAESNQITQISNKDFSPHKKLVYISFSHNRITNLDSNLFDDLPDLNCVRLFDNNIKYIGHDIKFPSGLVDLNENYCIKESATDSDNVDNLKFKVLVKCPPQLFQIETELENRDNLLTNLRDENEKTEARVDLLELINEKIRQVFDDIPTSSTTTTESGATAETIFAGMFQSYN